MNNITFFFGKPASGKSTIIDLIKIEKPDVKVIDVFSYIEKFLEKDGYILEENTKKAYTTLFEDLNNTYKENDVIIELGTNHINIVSEELEKIFPKYRITIFLCETSIETCRKRENGRSRTMNQTAFEIRLNRDFPNSHIICLKDKNLPYRILNMENELNFNLNIVLNYLNMTEEKHIRPTWDEYFMEVCHAVAKRATCDRGLSGCVIAKDKQILVTGYVGSPKGLPHCDEVGHQMKTMTHEDGHQTQHCVRTAHAEQNAIVQAAKLGVSIDGATVYCKMTPCAVCAKMIINSGIKKVICEKRYHAGSESEEMFKQVGVELNFFDEEIEKYEKQ